MGPTSASSSTKGREEREVLAPDFSQLRRLQEKHALYWTGVLMHKPGVRPHPPFHNVTVGGVTFPSWSTPWVSEEPSPDGDVEGGRQRQPGHIVKITEEGIANLKHALRRTVVRWQQREGRHAHGQKITLISEEDVMAAKEKWALTDQQVHAFRQKARTFTLLEGDEPLALYLYCVKVTEEGIVEQDRWRPSGGLPECILDTGIEAP